MRLDFIVIDKAQDIHALCLVDVEFGAAVDGLAAEHAAHHVDDLQGGVVMASRHHPSAAVVVGEVVVAHGAIGFKQQAEAGGVVVFGGLEGIARWSLSLRSLRPLEGSKGQQIKGIGWSTLKMKKSRPNERVFFIF